MFEDLQRLFRESVAAFRAERDRREPEDEVAHLLGSMRRELVEARALIPRLEDDLRGASADLEREREHLERTRRRGELAKGIGDEETARVAEEFAARHAARVEVLQQAVTARQAELELRRREADDMMRQYREADANRFALVAQLRRARSAERLGALGDDAERTFSDWDRMAERVADDSRYVDALDDLGLDSSPPPPSGPSPGEVEERLRELKRRMGRD